MDKLLKLVEKLRNEIVPESSISKMSKEDILRFITESNLLQRMRTFHRKGDVAGVRSVITDDEAPLVPSESDILKWRVGKLRKLVRDFHRATQILKRYTKFSAARLRSHIKRHRYEDMLYGDDLPDIGTDDEGEPKKKNRRKKEKESKESKAPPVKSGITFPNIIINTGDNPPVVKDETPVETEKKCGGCCEEKDNKLADQDFFGLIQKLAPNLYKTLAEKAFLLDMCALDRKRMEANVCPVDCRPKAWDEFACCEREEAPPAWFIKWYAGRDTAPLAVPVASGPVASGPAGVTRMATAPGVSIPTRVTQPTQPITHPSKPIRIPSPKIARTRQIARYSPGRRPRPPFDVGDDSRDRSPVCIYRNTLTPEIDLLDRDRSPVVIDRNTPESKRGAPGKESDRPARAGMW